MRAGTHILTQTRAQQTCKPTDNAVCSQVHLYLAEESPSHVQHTQAQRSSFVLPVVLAKCQPASLSLSLSLSHTHTHTHGHTHIHTLHTRSLSLTRAVTHANTQQPLGQLSLQIDIQGNVSESQCYAFAHVSVCVRVFGHV